MVTHIQLKNWRKDMWGHLPTGFDSGYAKALRLDSGPQMVAITLNDIAAAIMIGITRDEAVDTRMAPGTGPALFYSPFLTVGLTHEDPP